MMDRSREIPDRRPARQAVVVHVGDTVLKGMDHATVFVREV